MGGTLRRSASEIMDACDAESLHADGDGFAPGAEAQFWECAIWISFFHFARGMLLSERQADFSPRPCDQSARARGSEGSGGVVRVRARLCEIPARWRVQHHSHGARLA